MAALLGLDMGAARPKEMGMTKYYLEYKVVDGKLVVSDGERDVVLGGRLGIGTDTPVAGIHILRDVGGLLMVQERVTSSPAGAAILFRKARGTVSAKLSAWEDDRIGGFAAQAYGATDYKSTGYIYIDADGAITDASSPGRIVLATTPSGSTTMVERMRISSDGSVIISGLAGGGEKNIGVDNEGKLKYTNVKSSYIALTVTNDEVTWDAEANPNVTIERNGSFTLHITNLINGMSGDLVLDTTHEGIGQTTTVSISAKDGMDNPVDVQGNGSLSELDNNLFHICWVYDGLRLTYNIASYGDTF